MKLHEIVTSGAVGNPELPKRLYKNIVKRKEPSVFLDFIEQLEDERKKRKK